MMIPISNKAKFSGKIPNDSLFYCRQPEVYPISDHTIASRYVQRHSEGLASEMPKQVGMTLLTN